MDRNAVKFSATLSLVEMSLGSFLHAFHIPFRGQILSLNQGFLLSRASFVGAKSRSDGARLSHWISVTASCLKSLSPAGSRLHPMLAISIQGGLFSLGQFIGGISFLGHTIGISLISMWALAHQLFIGWLYNGNNFLDALKWAVGFIDPNLRLPLLIGFGVTIIFLGAALVYLSLHMTHETWDQLQTRMAALSGPLKNRKQRAFPWTIFISTVFTVFFLKYTHSPHAESIWIWLRPLGLAVLITMILRWVPTNKIIGFLKRKWPMLGEHLEAVHAHIVSDRPRT